MTYQFAEQERDKAIANVNALLEAESDNNKIESLKEVLKFLSGVDDDKTLGEVISAAITAALGESGAITTAISGAITAALGESGAITTAISGAITTALGESGDITTAISGAITAAIATDGSIETWADGRYEPKSD